MTIDLRSMTVAELQAVISDAKAALNKDLLEGREEKARLEREFAYLKGTPISLITASERYNVPQIWLHNQLRAQRLTGLQLSQKAGRGHSNMLDACEVAVIVGVRRFVENRGLLKPGSRIIEQIYKQEK